MAGRAFAASAFLIAFLLSSHWASAQLVDPTYGLNSSVALPIGVASYGLYNISNDSGPYQVQTSEIAGLAYISSMYAYNATPPQNTSAYGATVQLNAVLNVTATDGKDYSYWIQDTADLNTSNMTYSIGDNVWNMTSINGSVSNLTVSGIGSSSPVNQSYNESFYSYFPNQSTPYRYPLYFIPVVREQIIGKHPVVQVGYLQDGAYVFYDNLTFNISASSAYFLVTPYHYTPAPQDGSAGGNLYDAELVIAGEGSGETSQFSGTDARLWIGYIDNGTLVPFPAVAGFGSDTEEAARGIEAVQSGSNVSVIEGQPNYNETLSLHGVPAQLSGIKGIKGSASSVPTTSVQSVQSTSTIASTGQGSGGRGTSVQYAFYIPLVIIFGIAAIAVVLYFLMAKK